jgi:septal ring factor EnvC (AmiA/AmiB activator)
MFRVLLVLLLMLTVRPTLSAQSGNERELQEIRNNIETERRGIEQVRKEKRDAQRNRDKLRRQLTESTRKLAELQQLEETAGRGFSSAKDSLDAAARQAGALDQVANDLFLRLFQLDNQRRVYRESRGDRFIIASLLASAASEIQNQASLQSDLSRQISARKETMRLAQWQRMVANESGKKTRSRIDELGRKISESETNEAKRQRHIKELEQNARDLEALITKLKAVPTQPAPTIAKPSQTPSGKPLGKPTGKMGWPSRGRISRQYGEYRDPEYHTVSVNKGIDITLAPGGAISASGDGVVVYAEWFESLGKVIIIDHGNGLRSVYSHVDRLMVSKGDRVTRGQQVGAGKTDRATELHFELRQGNQSVNPNQYLE